MLKPKCFIIVTILSLSLQAKAITYCPCPVPWGAIKEQQEEQERREQEQIEQLNKLLNERIEQGKTIEITTDKDVELRIKQRKAVDITVNNKELSLTECILGGIGICTVCCLPFLVLIILG